MEDLVGIAVRLFVLTVSLSFHEAAHAWMAFRLGDDTAKREGRLTLNPMAHFDPLGTLMIVFGPIGWAKPVPVNPNRLDNPRVGMPLVAFAGPLSNIILGVISLILFAIVTRFMGGGEGWYVLLKAFIAINFALAVFNLLPIYPLDGSKVLGLFLPKDWADRYEETMVRWGMYPLILIILWGTFGSGGPINWWFGLWEPVLNPIARLFGVYSVF